MMLFRMLSLLAVNDDMVDRNERRGTTSTSSWPFH